MAISFVASINKHEPFVLVSFLYKQRWQSESIICNQQNIKSKKQLANRVHHMQRCGFSSAMTPWLSSSVCLCFFDFVDAANSRENVHSFTATCLCLSSLRSWILNLEFDQRKEKKPSLHAFLHSFCIHLHWMTLQAVRRWHTASLYSMAT